MTKELKPLEPSAHSTLRDQFAMAALTGLLASNEGHFASTVQEIEKELGSSAGEDRRLNWLKVVAKWSYEYADAMLEERQK